MSALLLCLGLLAAAAPAAADEHDETRMAGTWTYTYKVQSTNDPAYKGAKPATESVSFPADCDPDSCKATRRDPDTGKKIGASPYTFRNGVASYHSSELGHCRDTVTGEVLTRNGGRIENDLEVRLLDPVTRPDGSFAARIVGHLTYTLSLTPVGLAEGCLLNGRRTTRPIVTRFRITGEQVGLPQEVVKEEPEPAPLAAVAAGPDAATAVQTSAFGPKLSDAQSDALAALSAGTRSVVTAALLTTKDALSNRNNRLVVNGLLALLLLALMVFPAMLFNNTYEENNDRINAAVARRLRRRRAASDAPAGDRRLRRLGLLFAVSIVGAALAGLLDPTLALDAASLALVLGAFVSIWVGVGLAAVVGTFYRRARGAEHTGGLRAVPMGLVIAAICVFISRAVGFVPGYLYGVVGVMTFAVTLDHREEGRATWLAEVALFAVAIGSWFAFTALSPQANAVDPSIGVLVADAIFAAVFIGGIEGLLFGLVPLRFLPGHRIASWSRTAWGVLAIAVSFAFVNVLLRPPAGYLGQSSAAASTVTYVLFAAFGLASVLFWAYFRVRREPARPDDVVPPVSGATPSVA